MKYYQNGESSPISKLAIWGKNGKLENPHFIFFVRKLISNCEIKKSIHFFVSLFNVKCMYFNKYLRTYLDVRNIFYVSWHFGFFILSFEINAKKKNEIKI